MSGKHRRPKGEHLPHPRRVLKVICTWEFYDWRVAVAQKLGVGSDMRGVFDDVWESEAARLGVDTRRAGYWVCEMPEVFDGVIVVGALSADDRDVGVVTEAMRTEVMVRAEEDHGIELLGVADGEFDTDVSFVLPNGEHDG